MKRSVLMGLIFVSVSACALTIALTADFWNDLTDRQRVQSAAAQIADFDLPAGYQPDYAVAVLGYSIVAYKSADESGHLAFVQAPEGIIPDGTVLAGHRANTGRDDVWSDVAVVSTTRQTVRDQSVTATVSEGYNGKGVRVRSLNMVFAGRTGPTLLVITQPAAKWDAAAIDMFIASIR